MNRTIKLLMISDIFVVTGFGLIAPILAIFIKENLPGGTIFAAGFASTLFFITKCAVQLPFSRYVDAHNNKAKWLIIGTLLIACVPFAYIFAKNVAHVYAAQVLYGIGAGLIYPAWLSLWSINLDKKHEGFEWSLYSTMVGLGTAAAAAVGAALAEFIGFTFTFISVGVMALFGCAILFGLRRQKIKLEKVSITRYQKKSKLANHKH